MTTAVARQPHPWNHALGPVTGPPATGAPADRLRRLGPDQVADWAEHGYVVVPDAFTADEVAELDAALTPGTELVRDLLEQLPGGRLSVAGVDTQLVAPNQVAGDPTLLRFCRHPVLVDLCHDLIGPDVRLYWEQAVYKQPRSAGPVLWHQDNGYTWVEPQAYLTLWIALTDATPDNGCVSVVPGAHRDGTLVHRHTDLGEECWGDWDLAVDVPVRAGSVVAFSSLTPHATRANTTDEVRKAYIVQYVPDGAVAVEAAPDGSPGHRRPLDDPRLNPPVLVGGRPVTG